MKSLKPSAPKKSGKRDREHKVLLGLVEYYLRTGKPVGSHSLQEAGFHDLSTATIRNYFARLDEQGYLAQLHSSGGRIPTPLAFRVYAEEYQDQIMISKEDEQELHYLRNVETKEVSNYLAEAMQHLSRMTHTAVFLSSPRFDHDFVLEIKLVAIDGNRSLCIMITDFGVVKTEVLHTPYLLSDEVLKKMERYFQWRLKGLNKPGELTVEEERLAQEFYNEVMLRYVIGYSNFTNEEIYRTGFSELLRYPDFNDISQLANSLSLFENAHSMRLLLRDCVKASKLKFWIGNDLFPYMTSESNCTVLAVPYRIGQKAVGAFGILGPLRVPYRQLFGIMTLMAEYVSESLTKNLYKHKISFRQPDKGARYMEPYQKQILLEDQSLEADKK